MYLNDKEEKIIAPFYKKLDDIIGCTLLLEWDTGSAASIFDTTFDDEEYEEEATEVATVKELTSTRLVIEEYEKDGSYEYWGKSVYRKISE